MQAEHARLQELASIESLPEREPANKRQAKRNDRVRGFKDHNELPSDSERDTGCNGANDG
jgi:hypothetical protein